MSEYKYIVWVGGCDDYYTSYKKAKQDYDKWIKQGYDDVHLEEFEEGKCPPSRHEMEFYEFYEDGRYYHGYECHSCGEIQTG